MARRPLRNEGFERIYELVRQVPKGRITTYSVLAEALGRPRAARWVGRAMSSCPYGNVPCHRVIRADKTVGGWGLEGSSEKKRLLEREGIEVDGKGRIRGFGKHLFVEFLVSPRGEK